MILLGGVLLTACGLKDVEYYHAAGVKAEMAGKISEAVAAYTEALKLLPEHYPSLFNLGNMHYLGKNWKEARRQYVKAIIEKTNASDAWCNLGLTYVRLKERDKAYACFQNAWNLDRTNTTALLAHAGSLVEEGKTSDAIAVLEKGKKAKDGRIFFNLGMLLYESGEFLKADDAFRTACGVLADDLKAAIMRVRCLIKLDKEADARVALDAVKKLDSSGIQTALLQAELDFMRGQLDQSEKAVREHLDLFPDSQAGLLLSGEIAARRGNLELALARFSRAAQVDYRSKEAALRAVDILFTLKRIDMARDRLSVLVRSFPEDVRILDGLMRVYFQQGYYDKAAQYGERRITAGKPAHDVSVITGLSHLMNEDVSRRRVDRGIELLWPHRNAEPRNRLMLRYLYGALVEKKDAKRAAEIRNLL